MPQGSEDHLAALAGLIDQPIQATQPTLPTPDNRNSGWGHKTAGIAQLATNFLAGAARGRAQAYDRQQQADAKQGQSIELALHQIDASDASEQVKTAEKQKLLTLMGQMVYGSLPDSKGGKGKDGGAANPDAQDPKHHPVMGAMKGLLEGLLGPQAKKNDITPEMIHATIGQSLLAVGNKENSQQAFTQKLEEPVNQAYSALQRKLGHPPTFAEIEADESMKTALSHNAAANNGQFTIGAATMIQSAQTLEKEQQAQAIQKMKDDAAEKKEKATEDARIAAQKQREDAEATRQADRESAEDKRAKEREASQDRRAANRENHEDARAALRSKGVGGTSSDANDYAQGIIDGAIPPDTKGLYREKEKIGAILKRKGFNLMAAERDWTAVSKHISTLNGSQQTRIVQATNALSDMLPSISEAYDAWTQTGLPGGYKSYNKLALMAAANGSGESAKAAQNLITYINDAISETGQIYMGGNSPTDHALRLAGNNLQGDWNPETFKSSMDILQKNIVIRRNSILNSPVVGVSANSPYTPDNMRPSKTDTPPGSGSSTPTQKVDPKYAKDLDDIFGKAPSQNQAGGGGQSAPAKPTTKPPVTPKTQPPNAPKPDKYGLFPELAPH